MDLSVKTKKGRSVLEGEILPPKAVSIIQKVLRIDDRKTARETYEDEMRRYNPGGGFEQGNMRKVIERARDARKMERKVEIPDVFDLSLATQVEAELKKSGWRP